MHGASATAGATLTDAAITEFGSMAVRLVRESGAIGHGYDGTVYTGWLGHALLCLRVASSPAASTALGLDDKATEEMRESAKNSIDLGGMALRRSRRNDTTLIMGTGGLIALRMALHVANGDVSAARELGRVHLVADDSITLRCALALADRGGDEVLYGRCGCVPTGHCTHCVFA